ncbi:MAG TPA: ABC transporter ATP-binding protein, partial [candidate division Zixibacteria bacterium]|nr:ABC transporter ATP-binding protein [candidate division Zixibacteria bacterium]
MLSLRDIRYTPPSADKPLIEGLSFDVASGEYISVIGPNGSGKTTLALIIAGVIRPESGVIEYDGRNYSSGENLDFLRRDVGFLFQDPEDGILTTSVEREIAFGPENHGVPSEEIKLKIHDLAEEFNLREILNKPLDELSGGELERTAFAGAISSNPKILILDEPESYLDFEGKVRLYSEIDRQRRKGTSIIHITQCLRASARADRVISLGKMECESRKSVNIHGAGAELPVLQMEDISFAFDGGDVLSGVNFSMKRGQCVALLGPSGSGKTTFARLAVGLYQPKAGRIKRHGRPGLSFQFPARQLFAESVLDDVSFGPKSMGIPDPRSAALSALEQVGFPHSKFAVSPFALSEGEQRLAGLAGILATRPDFIFFDEPTAALDVHGQARFLEIVDNLVENGAAVAIITHDLEIAEKTCWRAFLFNGCGQAIEYRMDEIMSNADLRKSYGIGTLD